MWLGIFIIVFSVGVGLYFFEKNNTTPEKPETKSKNSPKKEISDIGKILITMAGIVVSILLIFYGISKIINSMFPKEKIVAVEGLQLMFDEYTPCNTNIDYKFELDTQGDPIYMKFPGIDTVIYYSGKGKLHIPPREEGNVKIISSRSDTQVRVRIWKIVNVLP